MAQIVKSLRSCGALLFNLLIAIICTGFIENVLSRLSHPRTINSVLLRTYLLSAIIACLLGFLIFGRWKSGSAKWVWIIGVAWFAFRALPLAFAPPPGGFIFQMSGAGCIYGVRAEPCMNWFTFTIPAVKIISYSAGAWLSWYFGPSTHGEALLDALTVHFQRPVFQEDPGTKSE